jgi:hypothetical protein
MLRAGYAPQRSNSGRTNDERERAKRYTEELTKDNEKRAYHAVTLPYSFGGVNLATCSLEV